jgi:hypothetical protein
MTNAQYSVPLQLFGFALRSIHSNSNMLIELLWWACAFALNMGATRVATYRARHLPDGIKPLPDVLLEIIPVVPDWTPDVFIFLIVALDVFRTDGDVYDSSGFLFFINCSANVMFIRAVTTWVTTFPSPLLTVSSLGYGQHDLMFSGHTTMMFCAAKSPLGYMLACTGALTVLCARQHYTVDVVIAIVVVELMKRAMR